MDSLNEYRQSAKLKYTEYKTKKDEIESEKIAKELKINEDTELINSFFKELDESINELKSSDDIFLNLQIIHTKIDSIIVLVKQYNRLAEIQLRIPIFIEILNETHSKRKRSTNYISEINKIVKDIFQIAEVEVDIELMDTSEDDEFARKLQEQMYNINLEDEFNNIEGIDNIEEVNGVIGATGTNQ